ncbi:MAG: response regulator [Gemmatimonadales bacterium]|nr:response regulator [Gemmatimonadales bacterium]
MSTHLVAHHSAGPVVVSVIIAVMASYAALDLAGRVTAARGWLRAAWLAGGALAMGTGIWSMHYLGMLALQLPVPVRYDMPTVVLSLVAAVAASAIALSVSSRKRMRLLHAMLGSLAMGAAIAGMHYTGMAAMRLSASLRYEPWIVALSIAVAVGVSFVALLLSFRHREDTRAGATLRKVASALVMGAAIPSMHYIAMAAVGFLPNAATPALDLVDISSLGVTAVGLVAGLVLGLTIITAIVDRHLQAQAQALAASQWALLAQERFLGDVIDAVPHLIFVKDASGRFTLVNKAFADVFATTPAEVIGKTDADLHTAPEEVQRYQAEDLSVIATGEMKAIPARSVTRVAGNQMRWLDTVKVPVRSANGRETLALGVATDITERHQLAQQLGQAQKMEAVGLLAGGVAHDFNNVLTAIIGHTDMLQLDTTDQEQQAHLAVIMQAAERARGLTQQLLAFGRRQVLQPRILDLGDLVTNMDKLLRPLLGEDIDFRASPGCPGCMIEADPGQIEQVIMNLAVNARDAMPRGGKLTIETSCVELDSSYAETHFPVQPGSYAMLAVTDTGTGIDVETRSKMFQPFFTTKDPGKGTGLGLSTVYGIVKQSGGYIWVYSEQGQGTTFKVYLPQVQAGPTEVEKPVEVSITKGSGTVLVVEDEPTVRQLTRRVLAARGYDVLSASQGREALEVAAAYGGEIDLLLTDVVMPLMGGRELAEHLAVARPTTKVLYLSGYTDDAVVRHGVLESRVHFLQKPFAPETLARKVREVLVG